MKETLAENVIRLEKEVERLKDIIKDLEIKNQVLTNQIYYP